MASANPAEAEKEVNLWFKKGGNFGLNTTFDFAQGWFGWALVVSEIAATI